MHSRSPSAQLQSVCWQESPKEGPWMMMYEMEVKSIINPARLIDASTDTPVLKSCLAIGWSSVSRFSGRPL
eukprot:gene6844-biopygen6806